MLISPLVHDRKGSGEPVVLIHGIGHRRQAWYPIFDRLAAEYDVIAVDLAGFGESARYPKGVRYNMDHACEDLAANFEAWGIERPHVVGNSLGGAIALELGARGLASSVTALSPAGFFGRLDRFQGLGLLIALLSASRVTPLPVVRALTRTAAGRRLVFGVLYAHAERHDAEQMYGDAVALRSSRGFMAVIKEGLHYSFDSPVDVPTTIAWGTKDRLLPYAQAATAKQRLPRAVHVALEGAGHVPMIDAPTQILGLIDQTVGRARATRAA